MVQWRTDRAVAARVERNADEVDPLIFARMLLRAGLARDFAEAADLCQAGATRMLAARQRGAKVECERAFLKRCILTAAIDHRRRPARVRYGEGLWDWIELGNQRPASPCEESTGVNTVLACMPEEDRELLRRHGMEGWTFEQIGHALQISAATAYRHWRSATARFSELFRTLICHRRRDFRPFTFPEHSQAATTKQGRRQP